MVLYHVQSVKKTPERNPSKGKPVCGDVDTKLFYNIICMLMICLRVQVYLIYI